MTADEHTKSGAAGVTFTETMRGFVSTHATDDYETGWATGKAEGSLLDFTVTVTAPDVDALIADPNHEALLSGTVTAPALSPMPLRVGKGRFFLLVRDPEQARTRKMIYHMPLSADDGRHFYMDGFKTIHDDAGPDIWSDTTTLFVTVREGDEAGPVVAKGIVKILINDFRKQLGTMKAVGARNKLQELKTMAKFGSFFMGALTEVYGGVFARPSASDPDARSAATSRPTPLEEEA
jgi:cholesterol oxidase